MMVFIVLFLLAQLVLCLISVTGLFTGIINQALFLIRVGNPLKPYNFNLFT
jgi:hypothetical protein